MGLFDRLMQPQSAPRRNLMDTQMVRRPSESYLRQDYPTVYGALGGLFGTAPDEMAGSVLDPNTAAVRRGAEYGFPVGTALGMLPAAGLTKGLPVGMGIKSVGDNPFVVYRGGTKGKPIATEGLEPGSVQLGQGAYFGSSKGMAEEYAKYRPDGVVEAFNLNLKTPFDETAKIIPSTEQMQALRKNLLDIGVPKIYVDELDQPYRGAITNLSDAFSKKLTRQGKPTSNWEAADKINAAIRKSGFDGIIADVAEGGEQYVAFSKNQFKPLKQAPYPQQAALDLAQQRAALPVSQGGLGLPAGNNPLMNLPSGLTRQDQARLIQSHAENFAAKAKEMGLSASVEHSGSKAGPSSYVTVLDPITGAKFESPFRFSGHSKGPKESQFVYDVGDDFSNELGALEKMALSIPKAERDAIQSARQAKMIEDLASQEKERIFSQGRPAVQSAMQEANLQQTPYTKAFSNSGKYIRANQSPYPQQAALDLAQQRAALTALTR